MDAFTELLKIIKETPHNWAIFFEFEPSCKLPLITLERFPNGIIGDLEQGTGDWEITGTIEEIINAVNKSNSIRGKDGSSDNQSRPGE